MAAVEEHRPTRPSLTDRFTAWRNGLVGSRRFQSWAARFPLTKRIARRDGERLFDLVSGFAYTQTLHAVVAFDLAEALADGPRSAGELALRASVPADRMAVLCQAAAALDLFHRRADGRYELARLGAALLGVPGLREMILHHSVLYRDLADPAAFFQGETETELAGFWPYVFGAEGAVDPEVARTYSNLMADSQVLVAEETLKTVDFGSAHTLLDIGGGTGAFLAAVGAAHPDLQMRLFDLPAVVPGAQERFAEAGLSDRVTIHSGSFQTDPLPEGADMISLVRVLYDHQDETVAALLQAAYAALPPGGRIVISEPMSGGARPERAGDAYFALYCLAMRTGTVRSQDRIGALLSQAGFSQIAMPKTDRPFVTQIVTATKP